MLAYPLAAWLGMLSQQVLRSHQHARRAIAALQRVAIAKGGLQVGDFAAIGQAFDGLDRPAVGLHREHQAGSDDFIVYPHRAGAAHAMLATDMRSRQMQMFPQKVREIEPRQDMRIDALAIDMERDWQRSRHAALPLAPRSGRLSSADMQRASSTFARCRRIEAVAC